MARIIRIGLVLAVVMISGTPLVWAQGDVDVAMRFFNAGGAYCFRIVPEGVSLNEETEWTVMLLAGTRNTQKAFRIRTVDPGPSSVDRKDLEAIGLTVTGLWRLDRSLREFVERFSEGIAEKRVRAKSVKLAPPRLAGMTPRQRAEEYLAFADRGSRVAFDKASDLTPEEFSRLMTYIPD